MSENDEMLLWPKRYSRVTRVKSDHFSVRYGQLTAHVFVCVCLTYVSKLNFPPVTKKSSYRQVGQYLNRLSDLLFQMARIAQHAEGNDDRFR